MNARRVNEQVMISLTDKPAKDRAIQVSRVLISPHSFRKPGLTTKPENRYV
jgi:hypothetical protein